MIKNQNNDDVELLYVWIRKYNKLENIGFNLSNKYDISYNPDSKFLFIKENPNYIESFFANNITSLKVLVGANGTGKSTFVKFILRYFVEGENNTHIPAIVLTRMGNSIIISNPTNIEVLNKDDYNHIDGSHLTVHPGTPKVTYIYHTPFFDPFLLDSDDLLRTDYDFHGFVNLSTSCLLEKDGEYYRNESGNDSFSRKKIDHIMMEFNRQVNFVSDFYNRNLPFKIPRYLMIQPNNNAEQKIQLEKDIYQNDKLKEISTFFKSVHIALVAKKEYSLAFECNFICAAIFTFLDDHRSLFIQAQYKYFYHLIIEHLTKTFIKDLEINGVIKNYSQFLTNLKKELSDEEKNLMNSFINILEQYQVELRVIYKYFSGNVLNDGVRSFVDISELSKLKIKELLDSIGLYYSNIGVSSYIDFTLSHEPTNFTNLSTGELSYLTLFSRLYWIKYRKVIKNELNKTLFIIFDEAEISFHPKWQKEFITNMIEFIKLVYGDYHVQILLTTHSPFILSDLPPSSIICLSEGEVTTIQNDNLNEYRNTFGANIHELLTDSFFMNDGLVGNFAKNIINNIIKQLNDEKIIDNEEEIRIKKIINSIGEEFIKEKLTQLLAIKCRGPKVFPSWVQKVSPPNIYL